MKKIIFIIMLILSMFSVSALNNEALSYYKFQGDFIDAVGNYNGTNVGTTNTGGIILNARAFGNGDEIQLGDVTELEGTDEFVIAGWYNFNQSFAAMQFGLFSYGTALNDEIALWTSGTTMFANINNGGNTFGSVSVAGLSTGQWYYIVMEYDGNGATNADRLKLYINDTQQTLAFTGTIPATTSGTMNSYKIGINQQQGAGTVMHGIIDEYAIFDALITDTERTFLYNNGTPGSDQQYPFVLPGGISSDLEPFYNLENITVNVISINGDLIDMNYSLNDGASISICTSCNDSQVNFTSLPDGLNNVTWISSTGVNTSEDFTIQRFQYFQFNSTLTGSLVEDFTFGGVSSVGTTVAIDTATFALPFGTNVTLEFSKVGFETESFSFNVTDINTQLNETFNVTPVTLTVKMFNSTNVSQQLTFDITILNSTTSFFNDSQINFSQQFVDTVTGDIQIIAQADGFADASFFNTLNPNTSITINGFMIPESDSSTVTFTVLEFGSSDPINGTVVEAQQLVEGEWVTIAQASTGDSGIASMNLDIDIPYRFIFTANGFVTATINAIPGTSTYTIRLRLETELFTFIDGVGYLLTPAADILTIPQNITFQGFVSGTSLTSSAYTLTLGNGTTIFSDTSVNPTGTTYEFNYSLVNTSIENITAVLTYIQDGNTNIVTKVYTTTVLVNSTILETLTEYSEETGEDAELFRWLIMIISISSGLLAGRIVGANATGSGLLMIPITGLFAFVGWIPLTYFAVLSAASMFFFIGGSLIR